MVLALNYLQGYYASVIARGQQKLGNYHLCSEFSNSLAMTLFLPECKVYSPAEIVSQIKENMFCQPDISSQTTFSLIDTNVSSETSSSNSVLPDLSQIERAKCVIEENKISYDFKLRTFTVMGLTRPHVITLHPKESCSCPSTNQWYHILAAKMRIGSQQDPKRKRINLMQLYKSSRPKNSKTSGRKRPHPGNCDIIPAPDAAVKKQKSLYGEPLYKHRCFLVYITSVGNNVTEIKDSPLENHMNDVDISSSFKTGDSSSKLKQ